MTDCFALSFDMSEQSLLGITYLLIYLDPPFNSNRNYAAPIGSKAAGAAFKDTWPLSDIDQAEHGEGAPSLHTVIQAAREAHGKGMQNYRIIMSTPPTRDVPHPEQHRQHLPLLGLDGEPLSEDGDGYSIWKDNFRNEVIWKRTDMRDTPLARMPKHTLFGLQEGVCGAAGFSSRFGI